MMHYAGIQLIFLNGLFMFEVIANTIERRPLNPTAKETVSAIRETIHGALGVVQFKDDQENKKEFDSSVRELAVGIANLILVGVHEKQNRAKEEQDAFIEELMCIIIAQVQTDCV